MPEENTKAKPTNDTLKKVVQKIDDASNILVAVSKNPTADELAAALGLTMMLDSIGKHATAIFSGETPEIVKFLEPEKTFESNTNSLQDFIIALNKDKADHLRYKVDGDYVKVFITPYKTTLDEGDLEFSHGDYNVDLVIALGVRTLDDFDDALYEHNRIMHDAGSINITDEEPGEFAEVEWNEPGKSSVSEMVADLAYVMKDKIKMNRAIATALLTGIIAKTDRFSNDETTPKTMDVAAKLMEAGANQKQIAEKIEEAIETTEEKAANELEVERDEKADEALDLDKLANEAIGNTDSEEGELKVEKDDAEESAAGADTVAVGADAAGTAGAEATGMAGAEAAAGATGAGAGDAAAGATGAGEAAEELTPEQQLDQLVNPPVSSALDELQKSASEIYPNPQNDVDGTNKGDVIAEPDEVAKPKDYGRMMDEALAEPLPNPAAQMTPAAPTGPELNHIPDMDYVPHTQTTPVTVPEMGEEFLTAGTAMPSSAPVPGMETVAPASETGVQPEMAPVQGMNEPIAQPVVNPVMPEMAATPEPAPVMPEMPVAPVPPVPGMTTPAAPLPETMTSAQMTPAVGASTNMPSVAPVADAPVVPAVDAPAVDAAAQFTAEPTPMMSATPDMTVSQLEQANDPGAFKIPGM